METSELLKIVDFQHLKSGKTVDRRRFGAAINRINDTIQDLERFEDLTGVSAAIQSLTSLRQQLSAQLDETP